MRKTGDSSTSLGNAITNMCCLMKEINRLRVSRVLNYYLFLGDDVLISKKNETNLKRLRNEIEIERNM